MQFKMINARTGERIDHAIPVMSIVTKTMNEDTGCEEQTKINAGCVKEIPHSSNCNRNWIKAENPIMTFNAKMP